MARAEEYDPCLNQPTAYQSMSDSTPDSPKDLFDQQSDVLALHMAKTQIHLSQINKQVERWEDIKDDDIAGIDGKYLKSLTSMCKDYVEMCLRYQEVVRNQRKFLDKYFET
jgi:hypothetical protein|tara:strand:+ start:171 stop:503 length:333 start_codon:yes stop_codon:yes gene_type:complete